jgi:hypothetical protein
MSGFFGSDVFRVLPAFLLIQPAQPASGEHRSGIAESGPCSGMVRHDCTFLGCRAHQPLFCFVGEELGSGEDSRVWRWVHGCGGIAFEL